MIKFLLGLFLGAFLGIMTMCLLVGGNKDE